MRYLEQWWPRRTRRCPASIYEGLSMIDRWPNGAERTIGDGIMFGLVLLVAISVLCVVGAGACFILARRSSGGRARVFRWFAFPLSVAAVIPPMFVVWAVGR